MVIVSKGKNISQKKLEMNFYEYLHSNLYQCRNLKCIKLRFPACGRQAHIEIFASLVFSFGMTMHNL